MSRDPSRLACGRGARGGRGRGVRRHRHRRTRRPRRPSGAAAGARRTSWAARSAAATATASAGIPAPGPPRPRRCCGTCSGRRAARWSASSTWCRWHRAAGTCWPTAPSSTCPWGAGPSRWRRSRARWARAPGSPGATGSTGSRRCGTSCAPACSRCPSPVASTRTPGGRCPGARSPGSCAGCATSGCTRWCSTGCDWTGRIPAGCPAAVAASHYVERTFGRWSVEGGLPALLAALVGRVAERGIEVRTGTVAARPRVVGGRATGVELVDGSVVEADAVVWSADPRVLAPWLPSVGRTVPAIPAAATHLGLCRDATDRAGAPVRLPDLPVETVWHGDPLLVLRTGGEAPPGHVAWTLLPPRRRRGPAGRAGPARPRPAPARGHPARPVADRAGHRRRLLTARGGVAGLAHAGAAGPAGQRAARSALRGGVGAPRCGAGADRARCGAGGGAARDGSARPVVKRHPGWWPSVSGWSAAGQRRHSWRSPCTIVCR